jgi:hypothetical protein
MTFKTLFKAGAVIILAAGALTLTACSIDSGPDAIAREAVEASVRGETSWDISAEHGAGCKVGGSTTEQLGDGEGSVVEVITFSLDCSGTAEEAEVWMSASGEQVTNIYW